jgi:hypothetical protein
MKFESIEFLPAGPGEPSASELLFALRGVARALESDAVLHDEDKDHIADLAVAADCLARLLVHRMSNCPVRVEAIKGEGERAVG